MQSRRLGPLSGTLAGDVLPVLSLLLAVAATDPGLQWHAPDGCPSPQDAAAYLEGELKIDPATGSAEVWVESTDRGWRAEVAIDGGPPRELTAASCEDVMAAAMVVIAVTQDSAPASVVPEPAPSPNPDPSPSPEPTPEPEPRPASAPQAQPAPEPAAQLAVPDTAPRLAHWLGVQAGPAAIAIPALTARVGLRYELGVDGWALRLAAHYETPRTLRYRDDAVGGRFQAATAELSACWIPGQGKVRGALCVGAAAGAVFGRGVGLPEPLRPRGAWIGAHASAGVRWAFAESWRLALDGQLVAGLLRPAFHVGNREDLFQSPRLGGTGMVGIERRLP